MFENIIPLMTFVFPTIIFCFFWNQVHKFDKERENKKFLQILYGEFEKDAFPNKSLEQVEHVLKERYVTDRQRNKLLKNYRILRRWSIIYCVSVVATFILGIVYVILAVWYFKKSYSEYDIILIVGAIINDVVLGVPSMFKSVGGPRLKSVATAVDKWVYKFAAPEGRISSIIDEILNTWMILIPNAVLFWLYLRLGEYVLSLLPSEYNLIHMIILLSIYRYVGVETVCHIHEGIKTIILKNEINFKLVRKEYAKEMLKNNTYLLFLLFYVIAKVFQFDSFSFAWLTVEGIGIVYLLDTYFEKCQNCEKMGKYDEMG